MRVRDLVTDIPGCEILDHFCEAREYRDQDEHQGSAEQIEQKVQYGASLAVPVGRQRCQKVRGDGPDGGADDQIYSHIIADKSLHCKGLENDDRRRGTLQQRCEQDSEEHRNRRVFQRREERNKRCAL